jgi:hypothetical protein
MNEPVRFVPLLEPPPGGLERLRARPKPDNRWVKAGLLSLASGSAIAVAWLAIACQPTEIRMQLIGERLIGERSRGMDLQWVGPGRAVALPSSDGNVRIYMIETTDSSSRNGN